MSRDPQVKLVIVVDDGRVTVLHATEDVDVLVVDHGDEVAYKPDVDWANPTVVRHVLEHSNDPETRVEESVLWEHVEEYMGGHGMGRP